MPLTAEEITDINGSNEGAAKVTQLGRMNSTRLELVLGATAVDGDGNALPAKEKAKIRTKLIKFIKRKDESQIRAFVNISGKSSGTPNFTSDNDYSTRETNYITTLAERSDRDYVRLASEVVDDLIPLLDKAFPALTNAEKRKLLKFLA